MANGSQESEQWQGFVKEIKTNFDKSNEQLKSTVISQSKTQNVAITELKTSNSEIKASVAKIEVSVAALQVRQDMSQVKQEIQLASLEQMMQAILLSLKVEA